MGDVSCVLQTDAVIAKNGMPYGIAIVSTASVARAVLGSDGAFKYEPPLVIIKNLGFSESLSSHLTLQMEKAFTPVSVSGNIASFRIDALSFGAPLFMADGSNGFDIITLHGDGPAAGDPLYNTEIEIPADPSHTLGRQLFRCTGTNVK